VLGELTAKLRNEPTPEANGYGVGSAARLKLREQMTDVGLHRLLGEEQVLPDLAVHEPVGDELEHLDLAGGRLLLELPKSRGRREGDDRAGRLRAAASRSRLEAAAVVAIPVEDLPPLRGVHGFGIGLSREAL
jgi:hypothetical protein